MQDKHLWQKKKPMVGINHRLRKKRSLDTSRKIMRGYSTKNLLALKELSEAGKIKPVIDRLYPLEETAEAHRYVDTGLK